jgi:hypothetical protein
VLSVVSAYHTSVHGHGAADGMRELALVPAVFVETLLAGEC